jgi:chemotaxis protein CheC
VELTVDQKDALTELINIGYGRAAGALSELTGYRITLEVPQVVIHEIEAVAPLLEGMLGPSIASVNQVFTGPISGDALLLLDQSSALVLSRLLGDQQGTPMVFDANAKETITEVGNILLNACLGVFGNLLRIQVNFAVPRLSFNSSNSLLDSITRQAEEPLRYALMIHTQFHVKAGDVTGYLVIVLGIASLDRLLQEVESWEKREMQ